MTLAAACAAARSRPRVRYEPLQTLGGYYVGHALKHASNVYGTFALVIGLLSWIYLAAHITLLAAEANVVADAGGSGRAASRSSSSSPRPSADQRALTQRGKVEERRQDETDRRPYSRRRIRLSAVRYTLIPPRRQSRWP